jgi:hypothetical protein
VSAVRFTDGRLIDVIDADCEFRPCFRFGIDKGSFTPGVGYTRYHEKERHVCFNRHLNGCPHVGVHLKCGNCYQVLGLVMEGEERTKPDVCPACGSDDLYWLADVLAEPQPCCNNPVVPKPRNGSRPYRQTCKSCGAKLTGTRLRIAQNSA